MAKILDGKIVRDKIADKLKAEISRRSLPSSEAKGSKPKLVIVQVGDLAESNAYIRQKVLFGEKIGAVVDHIKLDQNISQENLKSKILNLNSDRSVHGIIVQMPIPKNLDKNKIIEAIDPVKDVDGLTSTNIKYLFENRNEGYIPATTKGILSLLSHYQIPVYGKNVVIVGRSTLVGKPTALALINLNATVTVCHSHTKKLPQKTKDADILIVAVGKPNLIKNFHVAHGQVVVDVGINVVDKQPVGVQPLMGVEPRSADSKPETELESRKLIGDVDFEEVSKIVAAITPVPGGIGPMTVASLFENLLNAYNRQH